MKHLQSSLTTSAGSESGAGMTLNSRTFRVFGSSTIADLVEERAGGSGTGPILLSQASFLLAHIANIEPVPLPAPKMPRPVEDRSDVGGAAQFNNIGPVPLSPL